MASAVIALPAWRCLARVSGEPFINTGERKQAYCTIKINTFHWLFALCLASLRNGRLLDHSLSMKCARLGRIAMPLSIERAQHRVNPVEAATKALFSCKLAREAQASSPTAATPDIMSAERQSNQEPAHERAYSSRCAELPYNDQMTNHRMGWVAHKNLRARPSFASLFPFLFVRLA